MTDIEIPPNYALINICLYISRDLFFMFVVLLVDYYYICLNLFYSLNYYKK